MNSPSEQAQLGTQCRHRYFALNPDLEAVVTDDPIHIGYLSGYRSILQDMPPYGQVLVATRDRIALITGASDGAAALEVLGDPGCIWRYGTFFVLGTCDGPSYRDMPQAQPGLLNALAAALGSMGDKQGRIGCDLNRDQLQAVVGKAYPNATLIDASETLRQARAIKLPGELDLLRRISQVTDNALEQVAGMIRQGVTEIEIAAEISRGIVLGGGIARFVVVTSGERSSRVDAYARHRIMKDGDLVRIDVGGTFEGYYSDMARTYAVGDPGELASNRYTALLKGEIAELDMIKPGVVASDVFDRAIDVVRTSGLPGYERNHCGHGIGLRAHEFPLIGPGSTTALEAGMVLCLETPYYEIGWGGMMVEDTVIVTDSGYELLTESSRELRRSA